MTDEEKAAAEEAEAALEAKIGAIVNKHLNGAITAHTKRTMDSFTKVLDERFAKFTPPAEPKGDAPAAGGTATTKADPEVMKLREQVEKLQRQAEEATRARTETEQRSRRESARAQLREALDAKGVKGAKARAVIADLEAQGAVRFDEETGTASLVLKRVRTKGARAEELAFEDLAAGIEDWAKSPDAAEFLPPPQAATTMRRPNVGAAPAQGPRPAASTTTTARPQTDEEIAEEVARDLERQGVDLNSLFE